MTPDPGTQASTRAAARPAAGDAWSERAGRLFAEIERPAKSMVRRAFRGAFSADELDDVYSGAWLGTLRALAGRQAALADDEIRSYVLTAVANQASKELRRRRRKPTAPLEYVDSVADPAATPEERAASGERSMVARDVLASLPRRRRAVVLLRYGWGLEPRQVCGMVAGLSPRAYRKEITRGVDELAAKLRAVETGDWCRDREPLLRALVSGEAREEEERQARAHLSHCRPCSQYAARLSGHLHELGCAAAASAAAEGIGGGAAGRFGEFLDRLGAPVERLGALAERATVRIGDGLGTVSAGGGGVRGGGAAGAGALAKLGGAAGGAKAALACIGGGVAATCIGLGAMGLEADRPAPRPVNTREAGERAVPTIRPAAAEHPVIAAEIVPATRLARPAASPPRWAHGDRPVAAAAPEPAPGGLAPAEPTPATPAPAPAGSAPAAEFGVEASAAAPSGQGGLAGEDAAQAEFGP